MNSKLPTLKRIEVLYGLVEQMHSVTLRQAAGRVREVEMAIDEQGQQMSNAHRNALEAMLHGNRENRALATMQREFGCRMREQLEAVRLKREVAAEMARKNHSASRLISEQVKSVVESNEAAEELIERRKAQATSDDRFLSRLRWRQLRFDGI